MKLYKTLKKEKFSTPPIWFMRQAGRYLPEYREIRSKENNFLDLCYNPKLASKITLQPIERFGFDGAILFSDILVIPDALGIKTEFIKNFGPKLQSVTNQKQLENLKINNIKNHLNPVFETIDIIKSNKPKETNLIGFSGSAWTIATYIIEGSSSKNFEKTRSIAINDEIFFQKLINILINAIIEYLSHQIESGVEIIQLFDSWAGILPEDQFNKWVLNPNKQIIDKIKDKYPNIPVILFTKGVGLLNENICKDINFECLAIDQNIPKKWVKNNIQNKYNKVIQGNLDNILLCYGSKDQIKKEVLNILDNFNDHPFIFNLGHGILKDTPIENVELVLNLVRNYKD
ncbi:uroporphyrinogen decarboxylase [Rickettsiales bacterium]|nr:uroporphyrinogen decarboxylase [Rickettsiales bacterium]